MNERALLVLTIALFAARCERAMTEARVNPLERVERVADGNASRPAVPGTVPRDAAIAGTPDVARGRERFAIYCAPCHGRNGRGDGPLVRHGFPAPPSLVTGHGAHHSIEHIVDVIANGKGKMPEYGDRIGASDRRAIAAYVVTLR